MKEELAEEKPRLVRSASCPSLGIQTIASFYGAAKPSEQITSIVVEVIYEDLLPVSTVEHLGFRKLLKFLAPNYVVPTRHTVQARLKAMFDEMKEMVISHLSSDAVEFLSLTTDLWTSIAQDGYIGVTAHFIDLEWEMKSIILTVEEMDERHTAANISERLKAIADEWKITKKVGRSCARQRLKHALSGKIVAGIKQVGSPELRGSHPPTLYRSWSRCNSHQPPPCKSQKTRGALQPFYPSHNAVTPSPRTEQKAAEKLGERRSYPVELIISDVGPTCGGEDQRQHSS